MHNFVVINKKEEEFMNLRSNYLPFAGVLQEENVEALFNVEEVSTKYGEIIQSEEFRKEFDEQYNMLVRLVDELGQNAGRDSRFEQLTSKNYVMELVRINVVLNAIGNVLDSIIFDGRPASKAVANFITVDFTIRILYSVINCKWEECKEIAMENQLLDAIYSDSYNLYS